MHQTGYFLGSILAFLFVKTNKFFLIISEFFEIFPVEKMYYREDQFFKGIRLWNTPKNLKKSSEISISHDLFWLFALFTILYYNKSQQI